MTYAQLLPPLSEPQYEALKEDIAERGQQVPILLDETGEIIDGFHRQRACAELGITPRTESRSGLTDEAKQDLALALNLHRRQLSREQRAELHARLREHGMSTRQIAETTGAAEATVRNDLGGAQFCAPPERTTGRDGKSYPATRRTDEMRERAKELRSQGLSYVAIGEQLGVHAETVSKWIGDGQRAAQTPPALSTERGRQIAEAHRARVSKGIAGIEGTCQGLRNLRMDAVLAVAPEEDIAWWGAAAKEAISTLREFQKTIRGGHNGDSLGT